LDLGEDGVERRQLLAARVLATSGFQRVLLAGGIFAAAAALISLRTANTRDDAGEPGPTPAVEVLPARARAQGMSMPPPITVGVGVEIRAMPNAGVSPSSSNECTRSDGAAEAG